MQYDFTLRFSTSNSAYFMENLHFFYVLYLTQSEFTIKAKIHFDLNSASWQY